MKSNTCNNCGKQFTNRKERKFCSRACSNKRPFRKKVEVVDGVRDLTTPERECTLCGEVKPRSEFTVVKKKRDGYMEHTLRSACKPCYNDSKRERDIERYKRLRETLVDVSGTEYSLAKAQGIKQAYGLTLEEYHSMKISQDHCCKICGTSFDSLAEKNIHVDHDHITGQPVAILCGSCNKGIGGLKEDPGIIMKAYEYVKAHKESKAQKHHRKQLTSGVSRDIIPA